MIIDGLPIARLFERHPVILHQVRELKLPLPSITGAIVVPERCLVLLFVAGQEAPLELTLNPDWN